MQIAIKTQTARATNYKEGIKCVNIFLQDETGHTTFQVGLRVTEWGEKKPIEPRITIDSEKHTYDMPISQLVEGLLKLYPMQ